MTFLSPQARGVSQYYPEGENTNYTFLNPESEAARLKTRDEGKYYLCSLLKDSIVIFLSTAAIGMSFYRFRLKTIVHKKGLT